MKTSPYTILNYLCQLIIRVSVGTGINNGQNSSYSFIHHFSMTKFFLFLGVSILMTSALSAQTTIPDSTVVSGTWTLADAPYIIEGRAIVPEGETLTIEPGVEVRLRSSSSSTPSWFNYEDGNVGVIRVVGNLTAEGTEENPIVFTRNGTGHWGCILIDGEATDATVFSHCIIEYAKESRNVTGIDSPTTFTGGLSVYNTSVEINNNTFRLNNIDGLYLRETNASMEFTYNTFTENGTNGVNVQNGLAHGANNRFFENSVTSSGQVAAVKLSNSTVYIVSSLIYNNDDIAILATNGGAYYLVNNTVYGNSQGVRVETDANAFIHSSIYFENEINFATSNPGSGVIEMHYSLTNDAEVAANVDPFGDNIFSGDPLFVSAAAFDFALQSTSPCINAGNPTTDDLGIPELDLLENPRLDGIIDMGAIEFQQPINVNDLQKTFVNVFPNPTAEFVRIESEDFASATLLNAKGEQVVVSFSNVIDLSQQPSGTYLLQIELKNGEQVTRRIIRH